MNQNVIFYDGALVGGALETLEEEAGQACSRAVENDRLEKADKALQLKHSVERARKLRSETGVLEGSSGLGEDSPLGPLVTYAARYAMGRQSYAVSEIVRWIKAHWDLLSVSVKRQIQEDIQQRLDDEKYAEAVAPDSPDVPTPNPLGQAPDRKQWLSILDLPIDENESQ